MIVQAYLFFDGQCEAALDFYKAALGAEVEMMMRFGEAPPAPDGAASEGCGPGPGAQNADKIMHASFRVGDTVIMASDGNCGEAPKFDGFSLSITVSDVATCNRVFAALGDGGAVIQPVMATFFSPAFGMVRDKFGVSWMILVYG